MHCYLCAGGVGESAEMVLGKVFCGGCTRRIRGDAGPVLAPREGWSPRFVAGLVLAAVVFVVLG